MQYLTNLLPILIARTLRIYSPALYVLVVLYQPQHLTRLALGSKNYAPKELCRLCYQYIPQLIILAAEPQLHNSLTRF